MSKYKVEDKVLMEAEIIEINDRTSINTCLEFKDSSKEWFKEEYLIPVSKTYEDGLNDAWELARKVALYDCDIGSGYSVAELKAIFNRTTLQDVFRSYTIQEALAKIEAYEESKAIKVGDVVETGGNLAVVVSFGTFKVKDDSIHVVYFDGVTNCLRKDNKSIKKTGRHIDIEHLLEQIRGNE